MRLLRGRTLILAGLAIIAMVLPSIMMNMFGTPVQDAHLAVSYAMIMCSLLLVLCFVFARLDLPAGKTPVFASVMTVVTLALAVASLPYASSSLATVLYALPYQFLTLALGSWAIWVQQRPESIDVLASVPVQD